jgi:hypothetical protein
MSEILQKTIEHLPGILNKNSKSMMQRIVEATLEAMSKDPQLGASAYCSLVLKASSNDLIAQFAGALEKSTRAIQEASGRPGSLALGLGLSIEPLDPTTAASGADFVNSDSKFETLCAKVSSMGVEGLRPYSKEIFLAAFDDAFTVSRIDPLENSKILPFARRALDRELVRLYEKLDSLT